MILRRPHRSLAALVLVVAALSLRPAHAAACAKPVPSVPAFSPAASNTLNWTQPTGTQQGSKFTVEVSFSQTSNADGSFAAVVQTATVAGSARTKTFSQLAERTYYYHLRAEGSSGCTVGTWSDIVATTQDATPPVVTLDPPSRSVYLMEPVVVRGTAIDVPNPPATKASGARNVLVTLENQIAPLAAMHDQPRAFVNVDADGTWRATFTDLPLGQYTVSASAFDHVDNGSTDTPTYTTLVVGAP